MADNALVKSDATSLTTLVRPIANPAQLIEAHEEVAKIIQSALKVNVDYGTIPGAGDKPTLLKPGAERLCLAFGATPLYELVTSEADHDREVKWRKRQKKWNNARQGDKSFTWVEEQGVSLGLYRYVFKCRITRQDGRVLGEGQGVCSTTESKYVDRPRDCENTVLKMAQKRALVAAVLNAFGLSNRFTQDVEDMDRDEAIKVDPPPAAAKGQQRQAASIYTGTPEQQAIIRDILTKKKVDESVWADIDKKLMNRPSTDLNAIIAEVCG